MASRLAAASFAARARRAEIPAYLEAVPVTSRRDVPAMPREVQGAVG